MNVPAVTFLDGQRLASTCMWMRVVSAATAVLLSTADSPAAATEGDLVASVANVRVDWGNTLRRTNAVPTYLDQVNPMFARTSPIHDAAFSRIHEMGADRVRYLHWDANGFTQGSRHPRTEPTAPCGTSAISIRTWLTS